MKKPTKHTLTGKAAEARPELNDLEPRATIVYASELDNRPKAGSRRERREAAREASRAHRRLTGHLRAASKP